MKTETKCIRIMNPEYAFYDLDDENLIDLINGLEEVGLTLDREYTLSYERESTISGVHFYLEIIIITRNKKNEEESVCKITSILNRRSIEFIVKDYFLEWHENKFYRELY